MESVVPNVTLKSGHKMPVIGLGTALANYDELRNALHFALECGYRSIDTAYMYMNEEAIGDVLQDWFKKGKLKREDVFVTSKLPGIANRPEDAEKFLTKSLKKLKLDYLDLYLIHQPFGLKYLGDFNIRAIPNFDKENAALDDIFGVDGPTLFDDETDLEALWESLQNEVKRGRVKSLGVSNFNSNQIGRIMKIAEIPVSINQVEIHLYFQQNRLVEFCQNLGIAVEAYGPLGAPYTSEGKDMNILGDPTVLKIAKKHGKSPSQIALKWILQRKLIVIPKSSNPERIKSNFDILDFNLSEEDMETLAKLDRGRKGRIFDFKSIYRECENQKEYPFREEF